MMEPASGGRGRRGDSTTAPVPIPPTTTNKKNAAAVGQGSSGGGGGGGTLDEGSRGSDAPAASSSLWARIADFAAVGPKERAGWHLRRLLLQGPPPLGADGDEVQVMHTVTASSSGSGPLAPSTQVGHRRGRYVTT